MSSLTNPVLEHEGLVRNSRKDGAAKSADAGADAHPLLALQRQVGNAQIQRMLAQRDAAPEEEEVQTKRDSSAVQREGAPEEEEEVQTKRDLSIQRDAAPEEEEVQTKRDASAVQREGAPEEEEEVQTKRDLSIQRDGAPEEEEVQPKRDSSIQRAPDAIEPEVGLEGGPVSAGIEGRIQSKRGSGSPLDSGTRSTMESSFGESFDGVRVHHDTESDSLNRSLGAKAFTTGNDIFFRQDTSPTDHGLLGHELTHVVQQRDGAVGGGGSGGLTVGPADDAFEHAADAAGSAVASGGAVARPKRDTE